MSLKLSRIKRDLDRENEGDWVDVPEWPGVRLKVRGISCRDYNVGRETLINKLRRSLGREPTGPEMEPQLGRLVAQHLLRGWEGITGDDDKPLDYSPKLATELLGNPEFRELELQVLLAANRIGERDLEFNEEATKNSAAPSATT